MRLASRCTLRAVCALVALSTTALAADILETIGFSSCQNGSATVEVERVNIEYNNENQTVIFDIRGTSNKEQNVTAELSITAFGADIFSNSFNPCDQGTFVERLCPGKYPLAHTHTHVDGEDADRRHVPSPRG